ncbi:MAG: DUF1295 domain-containing protein [Erysipelotrichaceae bacterium]|nr:DUF1295 domain-containing protein [Erysipelotrichaceae bacterium]
MFTKSMLVLLIAGLILTVIGFKQFVWFMSIGYGLAVMGYGLILLFMGLKAGASLAYLLLCVVLAIYGCRLGLFLLVREMKDKNFKNTEAAKSGAKAVPIFVKVSMWIMCPILYILQASPLIYRLENGVFDGASLLIGLAISIIGVLMETVSDAQKSAAKKANPRRFCDTGLFKICRCPNYFGEILVWTGVFVSSFGALSGLQWLLAIIGYVAIVYIMVEGAIRLEKRHNKNYGNDPEYVKYSNTTPILVPFVPLYHLVKEK